MFKSAILIGTMFASNLAGVCCAAGMPMTVSHHEMMMSSGYAETDNAPQVQPVQSQCASQAVNVPVVERDLESGYAMDQRIIRGLQSVPVGIAPTAAYPILPVSTQGYYWNGCGFHGASPPQILEQSSGNQLLF